MTTTTKTPAATSKKVELTSVLTKCLKSTETELLTLASKILKSAGYSCTRQKSDHWIVAHPQEQQPANHIGLVAHCDLVGDKPPTLLSLDNEIVRNAAPGGGILGADDRAGVAAILYLVLLGHRPYVYLTTGEEAGGTGARDLANRKDYRPPATVRLLIEPDRMDWNDFVTYQCDSEPLNTYCRKFDFEKATGSFTDISVLAPEWGIAAANLSIGYKFQHSRNERLVLPHFAHTVRRMERMLLDPPEERIIYKATTYANNYSGGGYYSKKRTTPSIAAQIWDAVKKCFLMVAEPPKAKTAAKTDYKKPDIRAHNGLQFNFPAGTNYKTEMLRRDYLWVGDQQNDRTFGYVHRSKLSNKERKRLDRAQCAANVPIDPYAAHRAKWKLVNDPKPAGPGAAQDAAQADADSQDTEELTLGPTPAELTALAAEESQPVTLPLESLAPLLELATDNAPSQQPKDCECLKCGKGYHWTDTDNFDPINAVCLKCLAALQVQHGSQSPPLHPVPATIAHSPDDDES